MGSLRLKHTNEAFRAELTFPIFFEHCFRKQICYSWKQRRWRSFKNEPRVGPRDDPQDAPSKDVRVGWQRRQCEQPAPHNIPAVPTVLLSKGAQPECWLINSYRTREVMSHSGPYYTRIIQCKPCTSNRLGSRETPGMGKKESPEVHLYAAITKHLAQTQNKTKTQNTRADTFLVCNWFLLETK